MAFFDGYLLDSSYDSTRFCYVRARILREAQKEDAVVDALLAALGAPFNSTARRRLSKDEKLLALEKHIPHLARLKGSAWHGNALDEIFAAGVLLSKLSSSEKGKIFGSVKAEEELRVPIAAWLTSKKLSVHDEIAMGQSRVDVLGYRPGTFWQSEQVIAVELKNQLAQLRRGLDQMTNYSDYAHQVYLACTPALAASYLKGHFASPEVRCWDAKALDRKLDKFGFGLLIVEGTDVYEVRTPKNHTPAENQLDELRRALA